MEADILSLENESGNSNLHLKTFFRRDVSDPNGKNQITLKKNKIKKATVKIKEAKDVKTAIFNKSVDLNFQADSTKGGLLLQIYDSEKKDLLAGTCRQSSHE